MPSSPEGYLSYIIVPLFAMILLTSGIQASRPTTTICIDPGHPSEVGEGTRGKNVTEIHIAWVVGKQLEKLLEIKGIKVVMTKKAENQFVKNVDRARIANECHADLMVRLHCDSASGRGFATYFPDRQGTAAGFKGPDLALIKRIGPIAKQFHNVLSKDLSGFLTDNGNRPDIQTAVGSKYGALIASIHSRVPVVLVEMCVLTSRQDEKLVSTVKGQTRLAEALADACLKSIDKSHWDKNP